MDGKGEYEDVILSNLEECAAFVNEAATKTSPAISVGDFNSGIGSQQVKALVGEAKLVRTMTLDSGIDHIFVQENPRYDFKIMETVLIQGMVDVGGKKIGLSDHFGYMSTILITPK